MAWLQDGHPNHPGTKRKLVHGGLWRSIWGRGSKFQSWKAIFEGLWSHVEIWIRAFGDLRCQVRRGDEQKWFSCVDVAEKWTNTLWTLNVPRLAL